MKAFIKALIFTLITLMIMGICMGIIWLADTYLFSERASMGIWITLLVLCIFIPAYKLFKNKP